MNFFKTFLASLLAFVVGGILITVMSVMILVGIAAGLGSGAATVRDNSILKIDLSQGITDSPATSAFSSVGLGGIEIDNSNTILQAIKAIERAGYDDKIKGIYIHLQNKPISRANIEELRNALQEFKSTGKLIISYQTGFGQYGYYLSSVADKVILHPQGLLQWNGLSATVLFYKGVLDKLGVKAEILRHGTFKSAVEPFMLDKMSPENREQYTVMLSGMWDALLSDISVSRGIDKQILNNYADDLAIRSAQDALLYGMVDALLYEDQVTELLNRIVQGKPLETELADIVATDFMSSPQEEDAQRKEKSRRGPRFISLDRYIAATEKDDKQTSKNKIALIYADGEIIDGKSSDGIVGDVTLAAKIARARTDKNVKAIVLRVNSPGGSALASDVIWREMEVARSVKPVIVSMGSMAASGGYYISCGADIILAGKSTLTGSIGVFGILLNVEKGAREKLGLTADIVNTNTYSDLGTPFRQLTAHERGYFMSSVEQVYSTFIARVAQGRNLSLDRVDQIGQGRVWSGVDALRLGLIDGYGGIKDAIGIAADRAGIIDDFRVWELVDQPDTFTMMVRSFMTAIAERHSPELALALRDQKKLINMLRDRTVQARLPYDVEIN